MNVHSWLAISFEERFYIGRVKSVCEKGEKLDMEFVQKWDGRYRWPIRKDEAVVDKKFILSGVEMRASGKHFELHHPTEMELSRKHEEYCKKFFIAESGSDDCDMTTLSPPTPVNEFYPVQEKWQTTKCSKFELNFNAPIPTMMQPMSISSTPEKQVEVIADGNCFFRSICYWLTGDTDMKEHHKVRSAVVTFMREEWHEEGKRIVGKNYNDYLEKSRMERDGTWASENEIFATADLLRTTIMVFTKGMKKYKWVTHNPSTQGERGYSKQKIYLINASKHYQPVLTICK